MACAARILLTLTLTVLSGFSAYEINPPPWTGFLQSNATPTHCVQAMGSSLGLAECDYSSMDQLIDFNYFWTYDSTPGVLKFYSNGQVMQTESIDGFVVNVGTVPGTGATGNQKWEIGWGAWAGVFQLRLPAAEDSCLTAESGGSLNGGDCWQNGGSDTQRWRMIQWPRITDPEQYHVMIRSAGLPASCLDNLGVSILNGATVGLFPCTPSAPNQHWKIEVPTPDKTLHVFRNLANAADKCLQVNGEATYDGALVTQWTCPTNPAVTPAHYLWATKSNDQPSSTQRILFENANAHGKALTSSVMGAFHTIYAYGNPPSLWQLFQYRNPAQYLLPYGSLCLGNLECLSTNCVLTCQKGANGKPCQTDADCFPGKCYSGNCASPN